MQQSTSKTKRSPRALAVVLTWALLLALSVVIGMIFIGSLHFELATWQSLLPAALAWTAIAITTMLLVALRQIHWLEQQL